MSQEKRTPEEVASEGGKARAAKLTPEARKEIARRAAESRWSKDLPVVTHGSLDHPLRIGTTEIPCFVLNTGQRVLTLTGMLAALGMKQGGDKRFAARGEAGDRLMRFVRGNAVSRFVSAGVRDKIENPIKFPLPALPGRGGGGIANGYEAEVLADLVDAILEARKDGVLREHQLHIAARCEILSRAFMKVGIVALVDEATGFQYNRARDALEEILEKFIAKEFVKWTKMFPDDFYFELFRLKKWRFNPIPTRRPVLVAKLTRDVVYERLAPGVLTELERLTPRDDKGRLKKKLFQRLTEDIGHPRLREHLWAVIALMRSSDDWDVFYRSLNRALPPYIQMPLFDTDWNARLAAMEAKLLEDGSADLTSSTEPPPPSSQSPTASSP